MSRSSLSIIKNSALAMLSCSMIAIPANATPVPDVFGHNADGNVRQQLKPLTTDPSLKKQAETPKIGAASMAMMSDDKPVVRWFEAHDRLLNEACPKPSEIVILYRPMNQELDRVKAMTKTCADISKRYKIGAAKLRKMPVQEDWAAVKDLRDGQADFYEQEAAVYDEMIKPRPPSRTVEELDATLKTLEEHATEARDYGKQLASMDLDLRAQFGVHHNRFTDDLAKYVMSTKREGIMVTPK